jgi:LCP family protein required for cell wall assembly
MKLNTINKFIVLAFLLFVVIIFYNFLINHCFKKTWQKVITILVSIVLCFGFFQVNKLLLGYNSLLSKMNANSKTVYSTSLIAKKNSVINKVEDITSTTKIGVQPITSYENGTMALEEVEKLNKTTNIKVYDNLENAIKDLNDNKVDLISIKNLNDKKLLAINKNAQDDYKIVTTFESTQKNSDDNKYLHGQPFTILVSGIDSRSDDIDEVANGDSNILVTFNPQTGRITTLSTPRDSYVQIQCLMYGKDKLTHAAAYGGTECMKATLEKLYDIDIDYTLRINFVGVVDLVNALDGIDIDVPINNINGAGSKVCEQNSHGVKGTICWIEGQNNKMDGEIALAFARNRYNQDGGDFYRGRNQQIVIEAILKKITKINNLNTVNKLMSVVSQHMSTDLSKNDLTSLYEIILSNGLNLDIEKLYISGSTGMINGHSMVFPSENDIAYASYRMDVNLELVKPQFPSNNYYVEGLKPSNADGNNPLRTQKMPFDATKIEKIPKTTSTK